MVVGGSGWWLVLIEVADLLSCFCCLALLLSCFCCLAFVVLLLQWVNCWACPEPSVGNRTANG